MFFYSKKNNRNGFTLIELLAVILILAIIALIAVPVIQDIVKHAKKEVLRDTAYGLAEAGQNKCSSSTLQGTWNASLVQFENNEETSEAKLSDYFKGKNPDAGEVSVNDSCKTAIAIWNDNIKTCAYKGYSDDKVALISMKNSNTCRLEASGDLDEDYVDTGSTGYKCSDPGSVVVTEEKYFTFNQTTKTITGYSTEGPKDLVIPCTIGGVNVENIGSSAFSSKALTSVLMPDTILTIGNSAFSNNLITKVELGSRLGSIAAGAFFNNKLTTLVLPDSLVTIANGSGGYYSNSNVFGRNALTSVTFGSGIETIGSGAFSTCYLNSPYVYCGQNPITTVDFSRSTNLKTIGESAFYGGDIIDLDLSKNTLLNYIGNSAFYNNDIFLLSLKGTNLNIVSGSFGGNKITDLTVDGTNVTIGTTAFANNLIENLDLKGNIVSIGDDAFKNNQLPDSKAFIYGRNSDGTTNSTLVSYAGANRSNLVIPDSITSLTNATFTSLGLNGTLNTGNGLTNIESSKFSSNSLTNLIIGESVVSIGSSAFSSNLLTNVIIGDGVKSVGTYAFSNNKIDTLDLGNGLTTLEQGSFFNNRLTTLVLPDSLVTIASGGGGYYSNSNVFGRNALTSVTFGSGIQTIGAGAFSTCYLNSPYVYCGQNPITTVDFSRATNLKTIGESAFYGGNITSLDLSNNTLLNYIGSSAFYNNDILLLSLNGTNLNIVSGSFSGNKITDLTVDGTNVTIGATAFANNLIENLDLKGNIVSIGNDAFKNNQLPNAEAFIYGRNSDGTTNGTLVSYAGANRSNLVIPDSITSLTNATFDGLGLTGTFNTGNGLTTVESSKFYSNALTGVIVGTNVATIQSSAFSSNLITTVTLSDAVTTIGSGAFSNNKITDINFGNGLLTLETAAFFNNKLTTLVLPDSLVTIASGGGGYYSNSNVFGRNTLTSVTFGSGIQTIGAGAFSTCYLNSPYVYCGQNPITTVDFSRATSLKTIGESAFYGGDITSLDLSNNTLLNYIGSSAFYNNDIFLLSLNGTNLNIVSGSFSGNKITDLTVDGTNVTIGATAFANNLIENLDLKGNIVSIGNDAFKNNQLSNAKAFIYGRNSDGTTNGTLVSYAGANRSNLVIPDSITSLTNATFDGLGLTGTLNTGNGLTTVESSKFYSNALTGVIVGTNVATIQSSAFSSNLITTVTLSDAVTTIGSGAFANNKITDINFGNGLLTLETSAFFNNRLTTLVLPDSLVTIASGGGSYYSNSNVFGRNALTSVTFGSGIQTIGAGAFSTCYLNSPYVYCGQNPITTIDLSRATNLKTIGESAFYGNQFSSVEIPPSVMTIGPNVFASNTNLSQILVKGKIDATNFTSLGSSWNGSCSNIIYEWDSCYVYSGNTITDYVTGCSKKVEIPSTLGGNTITTISANAFASKGLYSATIPSTITSIADNAFNGNTMEAIGVVGKSSASDFTSLGTNWHGGNPVVYSGNNSSCFVINSGVVSRYYDISVCSRNMVIPSGVTEIAAGAFANEGLNSVTMPGSMQIIGNDPFAGNLLSSMSVLDGANFTTLGTNWKGNLLKVDFQGSSIENNCYEVTGNAITKYQAYCPVTVVVPTSVEGTTVTSIGANAFKNSAVRYITIGSHIKSIGDNAFENNDIVTLSLNDGLESIGASAFKTTGLLTLSIPSTVMVIGDSAFVNNSGLSVIYINGKTSSAGFTSLGTSWNGTCNHIVYNG